MTSKTVFSIMDVLLVFLGLHWIGQGTEFFPWPSNAAMDGHIEFVYFGIVAALVGVGLVYFSRR